jgi:hypothetical protein
MAMLAELEQMRICWLLKQPYLLTDLQFIPSERLILMNVEKTAVEVADGIMIIGYKSDKPGNTNKDLFVAKIRK